MGAFRVLIAGGRRFTDYPTLRATLDALLAKRLPDVELLTCGGPGVAQLAASYASVMVIPITALVPDFGGRIPERAAIERRDAELVALADAAVVVLTGKREPDVLRLLELIKAKGIPAKLKPTAPPAEPEVRRGLPD
jgi:hypothetical protein